MSPEVVFLFRVVGVKGMVENIYLVERYGDMIDCLLIVNFVARNKDMLQSIQ